MRYLPLAIAALLMFPFCLGESSLFQDGSLSVLAYDRDVTNGVADGFIGVNVPAGVPMLDGALVTDLVFSEEYPSNYASRQEWVVAEQRVTGVSSFAPQVAVPFRIEIPSFAPSGTYRLDFYVRNGRRHIGSYLPAMSMQGFVFINVEQDDPVTDVPIIDVLRTNAEGLPGAYGPFVDNDAVRLEIWLTDAARPVDVRITACPWEDVATIAGIPDPLCANRTYHAASSPLRIDWQLPGPGPYGIRVEATNEGVITSTSRLRAVRNGTSSRIMELMPVAGSQGETLIRTILSPSADNSHEGNLTFTLVAKTHDAVLLEKRTTFAFALPTAERSVDRAIVGLTPVEIPAGTLFYELHAQVAHGSDVLDEYTRIVDSCAPYGLCCAPGMTVDSLRTLPYAPPR